MTKVKKEKLTCAKCGKESEQMTIYSINSALGNKQDNEKLKQHKQVCPNCSYADVDISLGQR